MSMNRIISKPFIIGAVATLAISGVGAYIWKEGNRPHVLEIYVFALKSGRSIFVRTPEDRRILIDGGANSEIVAELTKILPFYSRRIDAIIATNTEGKNISGLIDVLKRYRIDQVYIASTSLSDISMASSIDSIYKTFLSTLNTMKINIHGIEAGEHIDFDQHVSGDILFPVLASNFQYSKASAPEILMKISFGSISVALFGNASTKIQKYLVFQEKIQHSNVLIVSHNASLGSLAPQFIDVVQPRFLVYSKSIPKSSTLSSNKKDISSRTSSKTKKQEDPLAMVLLENRFNIQEKGTIKIVSDGDIISVY